MQKRLNVILDSEESITLSHACNTYGLQRFRASKGGKEYLIAKDYSSQNCFLVDVKDNSVLDAIRFTRTKDLLKFLMTHNYEITVLIEE